MTPTTDAGDGPPGLPAPSRRDLRVSLAIFGGMATGLVLLVCGRELSQEASFARRHQIGIPGVTWDQTLNDGVMGALACLAALALFAGAAMPRLRTASGALRRAVDAALVALVLASGFCWLYGARGLAQSYYVKPWDSFHYLLGPKYFEEVGHFAFYDCIAEADFQTLGQLNDRKIRDLRTYALIRARDARERSHCERRFTPARWTEFKSDYLFYSKLQRGGFDEIVRDHGYNGTPLAAFVAGKVANTFDLTFSNVVLASLLDPLAVLIAFTVLGHAFGWRWAALVATFLFTTFTDRGFFILGSFFRYHWLVAATLGIAALRRGHHARAGAWIAAATMFNVFPAVFFLGIGLKIGWRLLQRQKIAPMHARFVGGALACSLVLGVVSVSHGEGIQNYGQFFDKMGTHADLVTRSRIGLRYDFAYRGETSDDDYQVAVTDAEIRRTRPLYYAVAVLLALVLCALPRRLDDVECTVLVGFASFFYTFSTVEYYYGIYALLPLLWYRRADRGSGLAMLALPFAASALSAYAFHRTGSLGICNNMVSSFAITLVLLAAQWTLLAEGRTWSDRLGRAGVAVAGAAIAAVTMLLLPPRSVARASGPVLAFGGDVNLGRRQHAFARKNGPGDALKAVRELAAADLALVNLECVVATVGDRKVGKEETASYYFRARPEMLATLQAAGIDAVSTANNHSLDYGPSALAEQRGYLDAMRIAHFGSGDDVEQACAPEYRWVGDVSVALFGIDTTQATFGATANRAGVCELDLDDAEGARRFLAPRLAEAHGKAHLVLVATHWGPNRRDTPSRAQVRFGHALIDAGADAVLGSSAHMVLGIDVYKGKPILHGAGDLLFDYPPGLEEGALFSLVLRPSGVRQVWITPLDRGAGSSRPMTGKEAARLLRAVNARSIGLGTRIVVLGDQAVLDLHEPAPRPGPTLRAKPNPPPGSTPVAAAQPPPSCVVDAVPEDKRIEPVQVGPLTLLGIGVEPLELTAPGPIWVETFWSADAVAPPDLQISAEVRPLVGRGGRWRAQAEPCDWQWPTGRWQSGTIYRDLIGIRPPDVLQEGFARILVGLMQSDGRKVAPIPTARVVTIDLKADH